MTTQLKFIWNGIKGSDGKLQKCSYSAGMLKNFPMGTVSIYAKDYTRFSAEIREAFIVENNSDSRADYFDFDTIRVIPSHPLYCDVLGAMGAQNMRQRNRKQST